MLFKQQYTRIQQEQLQEEQELASSTTSAETHTGDNKLLQSAENNDHDQSTTPQTQTQSQTQLQTKQYTADTHDYWVMGIIVFWSAIIAILSFANSFSDDTKQLLVGIVVNANLLFFYGAPLSTIAQVLSNRNSATLHVPTMLTNTANGVFWTCYGFAVLDYFIYVPNGLGALFGGIQIFLYMVFPRNESNGNDSRGATAAGGTQSEPTKSSQNEVIRDEENGQEVPDDVTST